MRLASCTLLVGLALGWALANAPSVFAEDAGQPWPFYAFQNGMGKLSFDEQAQLLKELGYDGIEYEGNPEQLPEMLKVADARGLKVFSIYLGADVDPSHPPYEPGLETAIRHLKGRDTLLSLHIQGGTPSSTDLDDRAVAILRKIAEMAQPSGLRIAVYPHVGHYVARVEDGIRLVKKVDRPNVGVGFNLCHFLRLDEEKNLEDRLNEAKPYLFTVSINGADAGNTTEMDWPRLIQTLDRGSFKVGRLLEMLQRIGFTGPVGLQCYAVPGEPRENLKRSMAAWQTLRSPSTDEAQEGFVPMFNGKDLSGWEGEPGYWSVEDGAITGTTTAENPLDHPSYLYWRGGKPANFELRAKYRFTTPEGNSGINFRSQELPKWDIKGYQADMEMGPSYTGILYECNDRAIMTERGQKVVIAEDGSRQVATLATAAELQKHIRPNDWNDYTIIARGPEIILKINGEVMSHAIDRQTNKALASGLISLQVHPGPACRVQFQNLRIKTLP